MSKLDSFLRRDFLLAAGALTLAGCTGGGALQPPLSPPRLKESALSFANDHFQLEVALQHDGSVHIAPNGASPIILHTDSQSGVPLLTGDGFRRAVGLPLNPVRNTWYTDRYKSEFARFNSDLGRLEVTNGTNRFIAMALSSNGLKAGLKLGDATSPIGVFNLSQERLVEVVRQSKQIVGIVSPQVAPLSPQIAARNLGYNSFVRAEAAHALARKTEMVTVFEQCGTATMIDSGSGTVLGSTTDCIYTRIDTGGGWGNTSGWLSVGTDGLPSQFSTGNALVDCIVNTALIALAAETAELVIGALGSSIQTSALIYAIGEGAAAVASLLAPIFLAVLAAATIYYVAVAIQSAYNSCAASGITG